MRERFNINDESYAKSLTSGYIEPLDCATGKSQAKFYVSYDKRYVIKTITSEDVEGLHNILTDYHKHIVETKGDTLLPHLLSMYRLTVEDKENYILVMRNIFTNKFKIQIKYDIKGSSVDRAATTKEKEKDSPTFKDNDLINDGRSINIGADVKRQFMQKLTRDVDFLCGLKMMDYSLLIGVHDADKVTVDVSDGETGGLGSPAGINSPKSNELNVMGGGAHERHDSDQDNLSPTEDTEDTDDDQLNCKFNSLFRAVGIEL
jgi:1-phosphatidylinositol-5-phosphate 4-kinase